MKLRRSPHDSFILSPKKSTWINAARNPRGARDFGIGDGSCRTGGDQSNSKSPQQGGGCPNGRNRAGAECLLFGLRRISNHRTKIRSSLGGPDRGQTLQKLFARKILGQESDSRRPM